MKNKSKRDMMGADNMTFWAKDLDLSYRPLIGLAAARIDVLAFKVALTPAWKQERKNVTKNIHIKL